MEVDSVCFYRYEAHLTLENGNRLSFSARFRFGPSDQPTTLLLNDFPLRETGLVRLLGKVIEGIKCDVDGTLECSFSSGDVLVVYANDPMYEAYSLLIDGQEITV